MLDLAAYVPYVPDTELDDDTTSGSYRVPDRMRAATGAVLPADGADGDEWNAYFMTVGGQESVGPEESDPHLGYGQLAEGGLAMDRQGPARIHPLFGFDVGDVMAEIDVEPTMGMLAVEVDPDRVSASMRESSDQVSVTEEDRDDGRLLTATCEGEYEACGFLITVGLSIWVGDGVLIVGRSEEVNAALDAVRAPNKELRATLSRALAAGAATGGFQIGPVQVTGDQALLGCDASCDLDAIREQLDAEGRPPIDVSMFVVGSAVKDNAATMVIAVPVDTDDRSEVGEALRSWQTGVDPRNQQPLEELLGAPALDGGGNAVVATFPVVAEPPRASRLWANLFVGRSLPFVRVP